MSLRKMDVIKKKKRKGFTLIELIVVIAIIGILAAIMIPKFSGFQDKATRTQVVTDGKQIATALQSLMAEGTVTAVTTSTNVATDPVIKLSGVPTSRITGLIYAADGTFTLTSTVKNKDGTAFVASRTTSGSDLLSVTVAP
ncbi:prepilin-type N-terminal cleavage/methylation domain-containing protein [Clostridium sp. DSM 17811]|nr:prepilin-type N-terminal cleavage/methylation domain-containing protein [Clostridium sp. DSM 17811]